MDKCHKYLALSYNVRAMNSRHLGYNFAPNVYDVTCAIETAYDLPLSMPRVGRIIPAVRGDAEREARCPSYNCALDVPYNSAVCYCLGTIINQL